jgi:hypothetical protein
MTISITHKDHLMWRHVASAMALPGGLGKKREDWLEHQHQEGSAIRKQYRTTKNIDVRANAIAGATQRDFNPQVLAKIKEVDKKAEYGPRNDYVKRDEVKRLERVANRIEALKEWEGINSHIMTATEGDMCLQVTGSLVAHLPSVGDARVFEYSK